MKIAMMTNNYKPFVAGVPISIERLSSALRRKGHEVVIFAPAYDGQEEEEGIVRYGALLRNVAGGFSVPNCWDAVIEEEFKKTSFDIIHVHHPMMIGNTARYLAKKYKTPLVFTYHTRYEQYLHYVGMNMFRPLLPAYLRSCTKDCELVLAPTPLMKEYLEKLNVKPDISVLPTGITQDCFHPEEESALEIRNRLLQDRRYLFCTVARLAREKNLVFLLKSMKQLKERQGRNFKLVLIGEGPEEKHLKKLTEKMGLKEEIIFAGAVSNREIRNYCRASDLFLFSSMSETQGIVLIESMAAGTPVLAVRGSGIQDIVEDGKNGYMTNVSEQDFAEKLIRVTKSGELPILRQGAILTAKEYLDEKLADTAESYYLQVIEKRKEREAETERKVRYFTKNRDMIYFHG